LSDTSQTPPRHGEGDRQAQLGGGGVFDTSRRTITRARAERRSGNLPEVILWRALKAHPGGYKFRRQHPIGPYILDFVCLAARLAIEVDGEVHSRGDQPVRDARRDCTLAERGFHTMRIAARDVLGHLDMVLAGIVLRVMRITPSTALRAVPLPILGRF
jgi:very-short-patch-repair endonuclease